MEILTTVLQQMSNVTQPQRKFILVLLPLLMSLRGRANFRNLSRYSAYHEKTFSRWYRRSFDFVEFNRLSLQSLNEANPALIAATDCSFAPKSGKHTEGLGKFYNGVRGKAEKGLEISTLALVNVTENTAYKLSIRQTPATNKDAESRVDSYLDHLKQDRHALPASVRYLAIDGFYSKKKSTSMAWQNSICIKSANYATMPACAGFTRANRNYAVARVFTTQGQI